VSATRNPFNVRDVPDPDGQDVEEFAANAEFWSSTNDANARAWNGSGDNENHGSIEGVWSSRWNREGHAWNQGKAEIRKSGDRVYILFNWDDGSQTGLIDARQASPYRLIGKNMNLGDPSIIRPWIGLIVDSHRIDGRHGGGRLDFRR
jgi:hypothetical protein